MLRRFGAARHETACVGDMDVDIETARRASLPVLAVATGSRSRRQLERFGPDRLLDNLSQLPAALPARFDRAPAAAAERRPAPVPEVAIR